MEKYMFVKSGDSLEFYSDNKPYDFKVHLDPILRLDGYWKVGLTEFFNYSYDNVQACKSERAPSLLTDTKQYQSKVLYLYSNVCDFSSVNGREKPLLRIVHYDDEFQWNSKFDPVYYVPLRVNELSDIHFSIKDENGSLATFLLSDTWVTLHFKRYPFY